MKSLLEILTATAEYLGRRGFPSPRVDAELLVAHALGIKRLELYLQFERPLSEAELATVRPLLRRRADGEPLQYILGSTAFYNCDLLVGPGVLIPRPETERLVEIALSKYPGHGDILDLCTGSGAIPLALAGEVKSGAAIVGVELSPEALAWAQRNGEALQRPQVTLLQGDLFAPVAGRTFALITANPPYVTTTEFAALPADVREHEPAAALVAGADGLDVIRRIVAEAPAYLAPDGWLVMEIGEQQGAAVSALLRAGGWREVAVVQDYSHRDRIVVAQH